MGDIRDPQAKDAHYDVLPQGFKSGEAWHPELQVRGVFVVVYFMYKVWFVGDTIKPYRICYQCVCRVFFSAGRTVELFHTD